MIDQGKGEGGKPTRLSRVPSVGRWESGRDRGARKAAVDRVSGDIRIEDNRIVTDAGALHALQVAKSIVERRDVSTNNEPECPKCLSRGTKPGAVLPSV